MTLSKTKVFKPKVCKVCTELFVPFQSFQKTCSGECALVLVRNKAKKESDKAGRKAVKELRDNNVSHWKKKAQTTFNRFIRTRDKALGCISCGNPFNSKYDAGHYRSVGAHPALRFDERNNNGQCVHCNQHLSGNLVDYRIHLVKKIGLEALEILEGPTEPKRYRIEDFKAIHKKYYELTKEMDNAEN